MRCPAPCSSFALQLREVVLAAFQPMRTTVPHRGEQPLQAHEARGAQREWNGVDGWQAPDATAAQRNDQIQRQAEKAAEHSREQQRAQRGEALVFGGAKACK